MLWYKAWLETRSRFLIALTGITVICSYIVFHGDRNTSSYTMINWYYGVLNNANTILVLTWLLAVALLAMGGVLREKSSGASTFTLALPVGRTRLIAVRVALGLIQSVILAIVPSVAMFLVGSIFGKTNSVSQACFRVVLILGGGLIFFALAILTSSVIEGEYTAPVVGIGLIVFIMVVLSEPLTDRYDPVTFMRGSHYLNKSSMLLVGPFPWMQLAAYMAIAAVLLLSAVWSLHKRDLT
jgi:ABC-2 type transport system permease protein